MSQGVLGMWADRARKKAAKAESDRRMGIAESASRHNRNRALAERALAQAALDNGDLDMAAVVLREAAITEAASVRLTLAELDRACARTR